VTAAPALAEVRQELEREHSLPQQPQHHHHHHHHHHHGEGHEHKATPPSRPSKTPRKPANEPEYTVVHRGEFDLANFTNDREAAANAGRPKVCMRARMIFFFTLVL
jgi:hypothetical protein